MHGPYCHACGQKAGHIELGLSHFAHEATHEFLHLDGKIFQTLRLLILKPGELTLEYFRGRRARYISPVRLYLTCSLLYFGLSAFAPASLGRWQVTSTDLSTPEAVEAFHRVQEAMNDLRERMSHYAPRAMFVMMPAFALLTWVFFRRAQRYYVPHLYYSIHFHAFVFFALALARALTFLGGVGTAAGALVVVVLFGYHFVALRRVFGRTRAEVAWKGSLVAVIYCTVLGLIIATTFLLAIKPVVSKALQAP